MVLPDPIPRVNPTAWIKAMRENTIPTAAVALVPNFPTKKVSAMLYMAVTSILMIVGMARETTSGGMGV